MSALHYAYEHLNEK